MSEDQVIAAVEAALLRRFGPEPSRASVSFVGVEQIEILRWRKGDVSQLSTLGTSRRPMGDPLAIHADPVAGPRVELLMQVRESVPGSSDAVVRSLAVLAATPAVEGLILQADATVDLGTPVVPGASCTGFVLDGPAPVEDAPGVERSDGGGLIDTGIHGVDPVVLLTAVPATSSELAWARAKGIAALRERFLLSGADLSDVRRRSVPFEDAPVEGATSEGAQD